VFFSAIVDFRGLTVFARDSGLSAMGLSFGFSFSGEDCVSGFFGTDGRVRVRVLRGGDFVVFD
jgi:hypothetical protein